MNATAPGRETETPKAYLLRALGCAPGQLPTLPEVALRVAQMAADDRQSAVGLAREVGRDQSLAGKVLQAANSPAYGFRGAVEDLGRAVVILGFDQMRSLALGIAAFEAAHSGRPMRRRMWRSELWAHSRQVAVLCELLAKHELGLGPGFYIHGLLHDIGKVALDAHRSAQFEAVLDMGTQDGGEGLENERQVMGLDHAEVGRALLAHWNFPPGLVNAVGWHHQPWLAGDDRQAAGAVFLADLLTRGDDSGGGPTSKGLPRRLSPSGPAADFMGEMGWAINEIALERLDDLLRSQGQEVDPLAG